MKRHTQKTIGLPIAVTLLATSLFAHAADDLGYDPQADPSALLGDGIARAKADGKLVLMIAGGNWCVWCHYLDAFIATNSDVAQELDEIFVIVKVYYGPDNYNEQFFSQWPEIAAGTPQLWVISADGKVLDAAPQLEPGKRGKSYDKQAFLAFIGDWKGV